MRLHHGTSNPLANDDFHPPLVDFGHSLIHTSGMGTGKQPPRRRNTRINSIGWYQSLLARRESWSATQSIRAVSVGVSKRSASDGILFLASTGYVSLNPQVHHRMKQLEEQNNVTRPPLSGFHSDTSFVIAAATHSEVLLFGPKITYSGNIKREFTRSTYAILV